MTMKDGICPKCNSDEIYKKKAVVQYLIPLGIWKPNPMVYACADCGYYEKYIEGPRYLQGIKEDWTPINWKRKRKNDEI